MSVQFEVSESLCSGCGECIEDCPGRLLEMRDGRPSLPAAKEAACYRCRHCFAVCPTGAISILGMRPEAAEPLPGGLPEPRSLEKLVMGRRSVRRYQDRDLDPALIRRLLEVAWQAPTGKNDRRVQFTVVDDRAKLARLRDQVLAGIKRLARAGQLPEHLAFFAEFVQVWEEKGVDVLFRRAPHLVVASAPAQSVSPLPDCLIALSTFDLLAQAHGLGTLWDGLAKWAINELVPEVRTSLGIPEDHVIGYVMLFGMPAVQYARTVTHGEPLIHHVA